MKKKLLSALLALVIVFTAALPFSVLADESTKETEPSSQQSTTEVDDEKAKEEAQKTLEEQQKELEENRQKLADAVREVEENEQKAAREFADAPRDPAAQPTVPSRSERIHDGDDFAFGKIEL